MLEFERLSGQEQRLREGEETPRHKSDSNANVETPLIHKVSEGDHCRNKCKQERRDRDRSEREWPLRGDAKWIIMLQEAQTAAQSNAFLQSERMQRMEE